MNIRISINIIIFSFSLLLYTISLYHPTYFVNYLSVLIFIYFCFYIYAYNREFFLLSGLVFYALSTTLLVNLIVEHGVYLFEIGEYSYLNGSASLNAFLSVIFVLGALFFYNNIKKVSLFEKFSVFLNKNVKCAILIILFSFIIYIWKNIYNYSSPLLLGIDRFTYYNLYVSPLFRWIVSNIPQLIFILCVLFKSNLLSKRSFIFICLISALSLIGGGEKFSGLILSFLLAVIVFYDRFKNLNLKFLLFVFSLIFIFLCLIIVSYQNTYSDGISMFFNRIYLQGQMVWAIHNYSDGILNSSDILRNFWGINSLNEDTGMQYLMYLIAPSERVDIMLENGATLTAPFPANIYYFFGPVGSVFIVLFLAFLWSLGVVFLKSAIDKKNIIFCLILLKFYLFIYLTIFMGETANIISVKMLFFMCFILAFLLLSSIKRKNYA